MFIHHVFFWLHQPNSLEDIQKLREGLQTLTGITAIKEHHIGVPANTFRDVIERSYSVSWMLMFATAADEAVYQEHPVHKKFVENYSHLWKKVTVFDAVYMD